MNEAFFLMVSIMKFGTTMVYLETVIFLCFLCKHIDT